MIPEKILEMFSGRVRLLIVDDDERILDGLTDMFVSPLFSVKAVTTVHKAKEAIDRGKAPWHTWILDIAIQDEEDGLTFLSEYPRYPFTIMLSGLRSMSTASRAMKLGAMRVFDKNPANLDTLYQEVCSTAALGFVLSGAKTKYLDVYQLLQRKAVSTPDEWATEACLSVRQLERICAIHSSLTARLQLRLFYAVLGLLLAADSPALEDYATPDAGDRITADFFAASIDYVVKNAPGYQAWPA
jgi:ActR/RegA family two-component response regulator